MVELDRTTSCSAAFTTGFSSHDVFLNFRGEDTRKNFTGLLHLILKDRGIDVFIDSKDMWSGEAIGPALLRSIEGSKISITIFSKGYAYSKWCLLELSHILQCHKSNGQMVLPIFFYVEPTQVRNQTRSFAKAFREHEKNFKPDTVESWREALKAVGSLSGVVIDKNMDQAEVVELVVKRVQDELIGRTHLAECKYPIGIDTCAQDILSLLNIGSNDVQFVGICGIGGIGKTTIAKVVYNRLLSTFKRHSFISDIREQAMQCMGLVSLQKRLLKDIFGRDIDIGHHHRGKKLIEQRLCKENVLLVLDDVDSKKQVDALASELSWFGEGSRVIITTRAEHILNVAKVDKDKIYWPQLLDRKESLHLFSLHAFSRDQPPQGYLNFSHDVVHCAAGLPLTLELLGSYLSNIDNKYVWKSTLQNLKVGIAPISTLASLCMQEKNTTLAMESRLFTRDYLNPNGFTTTCTFRKRRAIRAKIRAALFRFISGDLNLNVSTTTDRVGKRFRIAKIQAATKNFDESLVIGHGGFGKVYKAELDGTLLAIKRKDPGSHQGVQEFETEIKILSKLNHRHVACMIGFCDEKDEMILVYEYIANGVLKDHVFGTGLSPLTWKQRLEICIGAARGLHYLHTLADTDIIHGDVKTSNILLDENFIAKIADFGLSRMGPALDHSHVSTTVKGTIGYIDPEYVGNGHLNKKSDVFSFGVTLLEVVCARQPIDQSLPTNQISIVKWAVEKIRERSIETILDRRLERNYSSESLKKFGEVVEKCVAFESKNRSTMKEILWDLEDVLEMHEVWLRRKAGKNPSICLVENVGVGETQESQNQNTISQVDEFIPVRASSLDRSTCLNIPDRVWNFIWNCKTQPKLKSLLWRACAQEMASGEGLQIREEVPFDSECRRCGATMESADHIFLHCTYARAVWFGFPLSHCLPLDNSLSLPHWIDQCYQASTNDTLSTKQNFSLCSFIIWFLFLSQSDLILNKNNLAPEDVISKAVAAFQEFWSAQSSTVEEVQPTIPLPLKEQVCQAVMLNSQASIFRG